MQSAVLAIVNPSVRLSVRHTLALSQNDSGYTIMGSSPHDSSFDLMLNFTAKFQREHGERGRRMREG